MDWLTIAIIGILLVILLIVLCEKHQMQKETELFANQVEEALDAILSGRKWKVEEELEDSLWGRTGTQLAKAEAVFLRKEEESLREKEVVKSLISDMSHQTRTPIANMKLYMELLEEEALSENRSFFLTIWLKCRGWKREFFKFIKKIKEYTRPFGVQLQALYRRQR